MRFQVWLLTVMLVSLCTPPPIVLAIEVDMFWPFNSEYSDSTATKTLGVSKRFLRFTDGTTNEIQPDTLNSTDEERTIQLTTIEKIANAADKVAQWMHKKLFQVIEFVAGRPAADKLSKKFVDHVYLPLLYRMNRTPEMFLQRASQETDPLKKMYEKEAAKYFTAWIKTYHPS